MLFWSHWLLMLRPWVQPCCASWREPFPPGAPENLCLLDYRILQPLRHCFALTEHLSLEGQDLGTVLRIRALQVADVPHDNKEQDFLINLIPPPISSEGQTF